MSYAHPIILGNDYFANNLEDRETPKIEAEAFGFLKHKAKSKIDENEKAI